MYLSVRIVRRLIAKRGRLNVSVIIVCDWVALVSHRSIVLSSRLYNVSVMVYTGVVMILGSSNGNYVDQIMIRRAK